MKSAIFLITFLFSIIALGQAKKTELNLTKDSDTIFWKKIQNEKIEKFNLPKLNERLDFIFRKWSPGSVLEIIKNKDSLTGKIIYFVFEVWEDDYEADKYVKEYAIPLKTTKSLYKYITTSGIDTIPSEKYIKGWSKGFGGITHIYEIKKGANYSFKNYWTPKIQNGLKEAKFIIEFNENISEIGQLEKYGKKFTKDVPFLHYKYSGTAYYVMKNYTIKEWRKYKHKKNTEEKNKR